MSSLSSILLLNPKKLVLENFHLFCYILSYVQSPLTVKQVNYLLCINKYYYTLVNKLLSHHSFSNIFPVKLIICQSSMHEMNILLRMNTRSSSNSNRSRSLLLKGVNNIEWNYSSYSLLNIKPKYQKYKNLIDYIILSSSSTHTSTTATSSSTSKGNNDMSTSNRIIDQIILSTTNHQIIKYTLQNIHKTNVKHLSITNDGYRSKVITSNMKYGKQVLVVNNYLHIIKLDCYNTASYIGQFLTSCAFNKLHHIEISYFYKELFLTGENMPLLTSIQLINCENVYFDQLIHKNLLTLKVHGLNNNYDKYGDIMNLTDLKLVILPFPGASTSTSTSIRLVPQFQPNTFNKMKMLKTLILSYYNSSIAGLFDNLTSLTHLELPHYSYHYQHEEVLPSLPNLTHIKILHCKFVSAPFFQNINSLKEVRVLAYDKLALGIEKNLINLKSLHLFNISKHVEKDLNEKSILENIAIYTSLTTLSMVCWTIMINPSSCNPLPSLVNLTELSFDYCELTGVKLADIKNLYKLTISSCPSRQDDQSDLNYLIENCIKLKHLILSLPPPLNDSLYTLKELEIIEFHGVHSNFIIDQALIHNIKLKSIIFGKDAYFNKSFDNSLETLINLQHLYLPSKYSQPLPLLLPNTSIYVGKDYPKKYLNNHPIDKILYYE